MKLVHLSDLHLGKRVNAFSMLEDQEYILIRILHVIDAEQPDAVLIAGDIYDKPVPPAEAVELFDDFLFRLARREQQVFIISGNHDSPERLAFCSRLIDRSGIHLSPVYSGEIRPVRLEDTYGAADFYMLPFIRPAHVRRYRPDAEILTYTDAVREAVREMHPDPAVRNILLTHQFVEGAQRSDSEECSAGGLDGVDASVFDGFDYVALGHLHRPQNVGTERIRYSGTPLKYSFSEAGQEKSITVAELKEKGSLAVRTVPLVPMRDLVERKGSYLEVTERSFVGETGYPEDYFHITLTDEEDIPDAAAKLRILYPNLMRLDYDNSRTRSRAAVGAAEDAEHKSPFELFSELYRMQNGAEMSGTQREYLAGLIEEIWEEGK